MNHEACRGVKDTSTAALQVGAVALQVPQAHAGLACIPSLWYMGPPALKNVVFAPNNPSAADRPTRHTGASLADMPVAARTGPS